TSILRRERKMETIIAKPTTTSAAATVRTIKTNICPSAESRKWDKATNDRLTALSINSIDIKIMSGLRRMSTPVAPMVKRTALIIKYADNGTEAMNSSYFIYNPAGYSGRNHLKVT